MTVQLQEDSFLEDCVVYIFLGFALYAWINKRKSQFNKRMSRSRLCSETIVDDDKIIVALQIADFLVQCTNKKTEGFLPLVTSQEAKSVFDRLKQWFGYGAFYKPMFSKNKIRQFLKSIQAFSNVEIYLYTCLDKKFTEALLKKLGIDDYFPQEFRRYCDQEDLSLNQKKHPSWVDHNTRRVMIVTPNKSDCDEEDQKYFLILKKLKKQKFLKQSLQLLRLIMNKVQTVDDLHNQLAQIKVQIQSDGNSEYEYENENERC